MRGSPSARVIGASLRASLLTRLCTPSTEESPDDYPISADDLLCAAKKLAELSLTHGCWGYEL